MSDIRKKFIESKTRSKITEQRTTADNNPKSELTHAIFDKYDMGGLHFIMKQRVYRFRENYIRGDNGEYIAYNGFYLTVQSGTNPIETTVCVITTEQELRALYKIITKVSIDNHKDLMNIKRNYENETE